MIKQTKRKKLLLIPVITVALLVLFCAVTYIFTPLFMIHPHNDEKAYVQAAAIPAASRIEIPGTGLSGWFLDSPGDDIIVYFGGIDDDASSSLLRLTELQAKGYLAASDFVIIDWPGYGLSEGLPDAESLCTCAETAVRYFSDGSSRLFIMGYSMGTGPAVYAASRCECSGLVLIAPYESATDLYNSVINIFHGPLKLLLRYKMPVGEYAESVTVTPLILASESDRRVPYQSSLNLSEHFPTGSSLISFSDFSHTDFWISDESMRSIDNYLANPQQ